MIEELAHLTEENGVVDVDTAELVVVVEVILFVNGMHLLSISLVFYYRLISRSTHLFLGGGAGGGRRVGRVVVVFVIYILKLMYGGLPKGKKVLQRKEEERKMEGHWDRIKNARPNTTGWSFYDQYRVLNNGKKNMINEDKYT